MKLDFAQINRLSPPNIWDLGVLTSVISMLRAVLQASAGGSGLLCGRMLVRYSERLRARTRDNLNMRIKAWVLQCPHRIAHVRGIIGERAIRQWRKNRLANYALTKYFGEWQRKFPDGFTVSNVKPKRQSAPKFGGHIRAYTWKFFALVKITNVQRFLYKKPVTDTEEQEIRDAYFKLWGMAADAETAHTQIHKWTQPRGARTLDPIRFTPDELKLDSEEGAETSTAIITVQDAPKRIESDIGFVKKSDDPLPEREPP